MITTWSVGNADAHMPEAILVELAALVGRHPWWRARARLTLALLGQLGARPPARVLDAGCGWGVTLDALERRGYRPTGLDVSRHTLEWLEKDGRELIEADLTQPLPDDPPLFDVVLALDVIEHLDDDRRAVEQLGRLARPGGLVVVSVPAQPELFSEFDAVQGHRRRYRPETLRAAFVDTGLELDRIFWWGAWLLPLLRHQRGRRSAPVGESPAQTYRRHLRLPPWPGSWLLRFGFAWEQPRALRQRLDRGSSLFAVARRP
jgi:SAM-dependent methyltransferase